MNVFRRAYKPDRISLSDLHKEIGKKSNRPVQVVATLLTPAVIDHYFEFRKEFDDDFADCVDDYYSGDGFNFSRSLDGTGDPKACRDFYDNWRKITSCCKKPEMQLLVMRFLTMVHGVHVVTSPIVPDYGRSDSGYTHLGSDFDSIMKTWAKVAPKKSDSPGVGLQLLREIRLCRKASTARRVYGKRMKHWENHSKKAEGAPPILRFSRQKGIKHWSRIRCIVPLLSWHKASKERAYAPNGAGFKRAKAEFEAANASM